jgi:SAM-dependent methyltransferase
MRRVNGNSIDICDQLESWYCKPYGKYLLEQENQLVSQQLQQVFGYRFLQIGVTRNQSLGQDSALNHKINSAIGPGPAVDLVSDGHSLPFANECMDVVLLHHALEFAQDPHSLLREAHRVVSAQGHILILGFNPLSLFGLNLGLRGLWSTGPWGQAKAMGAGRLRDWLHLLGAKVESLHYCFSAPPIGGEPVQRYLRALDSFCTRHQWPVGGVYLMHAQKRVMTLTPSRRRWQTRMGSKLIDLTAPKPVPSPRKGDVAA